MPVWILGELLCCGVSLRGTALGGDRNCIGRPTGTPVGNTVILEVVPARKRLHWRGRNCRVVPEQRPKILSVHLVHALHPRGDILRLGTVESRGHAVEDVVVRVKASVGMCAL